MGDFIYKKVLPEYKTIGDQFRLARQEKNLTVEEVAYNLRVDPAQISALEEENYEHLPSGLYGKIFFKKYAIFLGLDYRSLLKNYLHESRRNIFNKDVFSNRVIKKKELLIIPEILRNAAILILILICFLYLTFYLKKIVSPPFLELSSPGENQVVSSTLITVIGQTEPESEVNINGESVLIDAQGAFSRPIDLGRGINTIVVKAKKKYSREQVIKRQILVEQ